MKSRRSEMTLKRGKRENSESLGSRDVLCEVQLFPAWLGCFYRWTIMLTVMLWWTAGLAGKKHGNELVVKFFLLGWVIQARWNTYRHCRSTRCI